MSKPPPFTVFSSRIDPTGVLEGLREAGAQLEVLEGTSLANWRRVRASWPTGAGRRDFLIRHDPDYYADDSWGQQLPGMFSYFLRAGAPLPVLAMIRAFRFSVSLEAEGSFPEAGDPRFDGLSAVCERLDGAVLVPSGLLDASGRALFLLDRQADEEAVLPAPAEPHPLLLALKEA